jgi:hypothetical protein
MGENINNQFHIKEFYVLQGEVKTLREMFESQFKSLKELIELNFKTINMATEKALMANDKRLDAMNEIKGAMKDQAAHFPTREELDPRLSTIEDILGKVVLRSDFDNQHERVREDIRKLEISKAEMNAKADQKGVDNKFEGAQKQSNRLTIFTIISIAIAILAVITNYFKH